MSELTALLLAGFVVAWIRGRDAQPRSARAGETVAFWVGMAMVVAATVSPLDRLAAESLTAHMVQHLLLTAVAAPLLVLARPVPTALAGLPAGWRRRLARYHGAVRRTGAGRPGWIAIAAGLQSATIWLWHAPPLYGSALRHEAVHVLEHVSFLAAAAFFWWAVLGLGRRSTYGGGVIGLFAATLPLTALGAFMATADVPWYGGYGTGAAALESQHMAGAVMWGFGGMGAVVAATGLFAAWLLSFERSSPGWPRGWAPWACVLVAVAVGAGCQEERNPRTRVAEGSVELGEKLIGRYGCGTCHAIPGIKGADALVGPPLTEFGQRKYIAGQLPNNEENLIRWITDPKEVEPGTAMPDLGVSSEEAANIAAYLLQLD